MHLSRSWVFAAGFLLLSGCAQTAVATTSAEPEEFQARTLVPASFAVGLRADAAGTLRQLRIELGVEVAGGDGPLVVHVLHEDEELAVERVAIQDGGGADTFSVGVLQASVPNDRGQAEVALDVVLEAEGDDTLSGTLTAAAGAEWASTGDGALGEFVEITVSSVE